MDRFDTGYENLEDAREDRPAVEQWFLRLHYRRLPHVHLLVADGVQYGARGFIGLQRKVCDVRHPKGNEDGRLYIYIEGGRCDRYREGVELSQRRSTTEHVRCGSRCGSRCRSRCGSKCWCNASRSAPEEVSKGKVRCIFFSILAALVENGQNQDNRNICNRLFCGSYRCCDCLR